MFHLFRKLARLAGAFSLGMSAAACATPADVALVEEAPEGSIPGPGLWEVGDEDTKIYLFGTIHFLPDDAQWYDARIARAFDASEELVTELDMSDPVEVAEQLNAAALIQDGGNLRDLMAQEDREQYEEAMIALGLQPDMLDAYEPWYAALLVEHATLVRAGYNPQAGVENALLQRASRKDREGLETTTFHIGLFDEMDMAHQLSFLDGTVEGADQIVPTVDGIYAQWMQGHAEELGTIVNADMEDSYLHQRLLLDRNSNWADWIANRLGESGTVFIAVGAGHLAGQGSVQEQLRARGIPVTRVWQ